MEKKRRVFSTDERSGYKDTLRHHLQQQKLTEKQREYWNRKPYDLGKRTANTEQKPKLSVFTDNFSKNTVNT